MFKKLIIRNFQSHKKTKLEFNAGVNVIIGQSDSGKTAIFRALKWLITNRPSGDSFNSWFAPDKAGAEVSLQIEDGAIIHSKGIYDLNGSEFRAIGTGVPEQIDQVLKMSDLNWQSQMDAPFLLSESSGEVSRRLNEVADLVVIDSALQNINRIARQTNSQIDVLESQKEQGLAELDKYRDLDVLEANLIILKKKKKELEELEEFVEQGESLLTSFQKIKKELDSIQDTKPAEVILEKAAKINEGLTELKKAIRQMEQMFSELGEAQEDLDNIKDKLKIKSQIWDEEFPDACPLCGKEQ